MKKIVGVLLCPLPLVWLLLLHGCIKSGTESFAMPQSAAWRETTEITLGASKEVKVYDYVVSNKDWAVIMTTRTGKTVAGQVDGATLPKGKEVSVEAVSPHVTLPLVFSQVKWLKNEGKMHREPHEASKREPSMGELEKDGDRIRIRYDSALSFPCEATIWRKSGEKTVITYSKFRNMEEAASRAEILRILAPIRK